MTQVFRIQDAEGRGPFKPGFSKYWIDADPPSGDMPDLMTAFGNDWLCDIPPLMYAGTACRSVETLLRWFSPLERERLKEMGYSVVSLRADRIIRENDDQLIFARHFPHNVGAVVIA